MYDTEINSQCAFKIFSCLNIGFEKPTFLKLKIKNNLKQYTFFGLHNWMNSESLFVTYNPEI